MRKTSLAVMIAALVSASINTNLWAETQPMDSNMDSQSPSMSNSVANSEKTTQPSTMQDSTKILPEKYLDKEIITSTGETIGKIDKLMVNKKDNRVHAVAGVGGFLGIGQKEIAIPISQLELQGDKYVLSSGVSEDSLRQEKKYEKSEFSAFEVKEESSGY